MGRMILIAFCLFYAVQGWAQLDKDLFQNPPLQARPNTYWEWMNGNISKEGITADLEYMKRANYGAAMIFEAGVGIPRGNIDYNSSQWIEMMVHTMKEAERLGLELFMHNAPGYSGTGGPWITVENSMKELVWTDTYVSASGKEKIELDLSCPFSKMGYYRDAYVLAYPSLSGEGKRFVDLVNKVTSDGKNIDFSLLTDNNLPTQYRLEGRKSILFELNDVYTFQASTIFRGEREKPLDPHDGPRDYPPRLLLEVSVDGVNFIKIGYYNSPALRAMDVPSTLSSVPFQARYLRISSDRGTNLSEVDFHASSRLEGYPVKINCVNAKVSLQENKQVVGKENLIPSDCVLDITRYLDAKGHLCWNAPKGKWTIVRIGYTTTGEEVAAAPDAGKGLDCDKLSKKGVEQHFVKFMNPLLEKLKPWCGSTLKALVVDSWEAGKQNWTDELPAYFKKKRGYDIMPYMLAVTGRIIDNVDTTEKFLWDFRRTHTDMFLENYVEELKKQASAYGLKYAGEAYGDGNFESLEMAARQDYPMSEFWTHYIYGNISTTMLAASAAHTWGKPVIQCECYTGTPFNSKFTEHPYGMKALGDYIMTAGVNRFVYHATTHQPYVGTQPGNIMTMGPFGTHLDRTSTWVNQFGELNLYNARCAYMLQQGKYVADILYLKDESISSGVENYNLVTPVTPYGYRWDVISTEGLLKRVSVKNGKIVLPDGMNYRILVVPSLTRTSPETLDCLKSLVCKGVTLLLCGERPVGYLGLDKKKEIEVANLATELWKTQPLGKGYVYCGKTVENLLQQMEVLPDFVFKSVNKDALIHFIHRDLNDEEVYFVANQRRRLEILTVRCRVKGKVPFLWNAETGEADIPVDYEVEGERIKMNLELPESGSIFIVFKKKGILKTKGKVVEVQTCPIEMYGRDKSVHYTDTVDLSSIFTLTCWAKPETFAAGGRGFVLYPSKGDKELAKVGFSMGQNGIRIYERGETNRVVLDVKKAIEGWTCVVLVYDKGVPVLYLNGEKVAEGIKSVYNRCVPSVDEPMSEEQFCAVFEGDNTPLKLFDYAFTQKDVTGYFLQGLPPVHIDGNIWKDLSNDWIVCFPKWSKAPGEIQLSKLHSLHKHMDFHVKHFSGTAVYVKHFFIDRNDYANIKQQRVFLNLGRVENIAEVSLNGSKEYMLWKAPYELNITDFLKEGENILEVKVTNLYPNRIIGDEYCDEKYDYDEHGRIKKLPLWFVKNKVETDRKRVLFLPWKFYKKTDPLLESGLLGNVSLIIR